MISCDVQKDDEIITDVAEHIMGDLTLAEVDRNIDHNEDRLTAEEKKIVLEALKKYVDNIRFDLARYCNYMNDNFGKNFEVYVENGGN